MQNRFQLTPPAAQTLQHEHAYQAIFLYYNHGSYMILRKLYSRMNGVDFDTKLHKIITSCFHCVSSQEEILKICSLKPKENVD